MNSPKGPCILSLRTPLKLLMQFSEMEREKERGISTTSYWPEGRQIDDNFSEQLFSAKAVSQSPEKLGDVFSQV